MHAMPASSESASAKKGPLVELRAVDILFGRHQVLRNISLSIPRGQTVAVIGESGCGKTTLGKTIVGLNRPVSGSIQWEGGEIAGVRPGRMSRAMQMIFQDPAESLNPRMTVGTILEEPFVIHGIGSAADRGANQWVASRIPRLARRAVTRRMGRLHRARQATLTAAIVPLLRLARKPAARHAPEPILLVQQGVRRLGHSRHHGRRRAAGAGLPSPGKLGALFR